MMKGAIEIEHPRLLQFLHDLPACLCLCLVHHGGGQVAHVHIDGVAEQDQLQGGDADDHAVGKAVLAQLAQFLDHHREQARKAETIAHDAPSV